MSANGNRADLVNAIVRSVAALASDGDWVHHVAEEGRLSLPMARWAIATTTARFTADAVTALLQRDLHGRSVLVSLAASVATAPLRAAVLPLLRGASRLAIRASRRQTEAARCVSSVLAGHGLPVGLLEHVFDPEALTADVLIAYGSDATLAVLRQRLREGVVFEPHGHGLSVCVVDDARHDAAARVALDVAAYDGRGCLSPQSIFVRRPFLHSFAEQLHAALAALEVTLPRGYLEPAQATELMQWQGAVAAESAQFHRGATHAVAVLDRPGLHFAPGARNVVLAPFDTDDELQRVLEPHAPVLTAVASDRDLPFLRIGARRVRLGTVQDPPLDGPEDGRSR